MPRFEIHRSVPIERTPRIVQFEGLFDLPPHQKSEVAWSGRLPLEDRPWTIGLIVGPSGSGKSTLARELFGEAALATQVWPAERAVVDAFPQSMSVRDIAGLLSSVGFSSPPAWLRPFSVLSTGEQFRVTLARALAEAIEKPREDRTVVIDEFTSVVDRTVARIGSAAVAKAIRRQSEMGLRFVAVSCHDDIVDWLDPDWTYVPATDAFQWRLERRPRPRVQLEIARVHRSAWKLFKHHHYLSGELATASLCFAAFVEGRPAAFTSAMSFPHPIRSGWREHRMVCLPDYQGIGLGNAMSEFIAALFKSTGKPYYSRTSHPAMIRHRLRSPLWTVCGRPQFGTGNAIPGWRSTARITVGFRYVGPARTDETSLPLLGRHSLRGVP